jgi:hypothetical protein
LGQFGEARHARLIEPFLKHADTQVFEVAHFSHLRLTDPLRVPSAWYPSWAE